MLAGPIPELGRVSFYQTVAYPSFIVDAGWQFEVKHELFRSASQWRLDFPFPCNSLKTGPLQSALGIAETILNRGTSFYCTREAEKTLIDLVFPNEHHELGRLTDDSTLVDALENCSAVPTCPLTSSLANSVCGTPEEIMVWELIESWNGEYDLPWTVIPQPHFSSLAPGDAIAPGRRPDFLLWGGTGTPIIVEVDGLHPNPRDDKHRDSVLRKADYTVMRIPNNEITRAPHELGPNLRKLKNCLKDRVTDKVDRSNPSELERLIRASKLLHQFELALLEVVKGGWFIAGQKVTVGVMIPETSPLKGISHKLMDLATAELSILIDQIAELYGIKAELPVFKNIPNQPEPQYDVWIGSAESEAIRAHAGDVPAFYISDSPVPFDIAAPLSAGRALNAENPSRDAAKWFLGALFRKADFREGQWEAVQRTLQGRDSMLLLPTAAGKSIAFQLTALLRQGTCIVVAPLIALMDDQIDNLKKVGIDRCAGISSATYGPLREAALDGLERGHYLYCFIAPERFQVENFRSSLRTLIASNPISLIAVDEAHLVSEWGHNFRTSYLNLGRNARQLCKSQGGAVPPLLGLTGTAGQTVLRDVIRHLNITTDPTAIITPKSLERKELNFHVLHCKSIEKAERTEGWLNGLPGKFGVTPQRFFSAKQSKTFGGLIFCPHVNRDQGVVARQDEIPDTFVNLGAETGIYSGKAPDGFANWNRHKRATAKRFKRDGLNMLFCTNAFGMGIDKPNIRYTVHMDLPPSLEACYQEAGRAGRDGETAHCLILVSNDDTLRTEKLLDPVTAINQIGTAIDNVTPAQADDITRSLFFHSNAFPGPHRELENLKALLQILQDDLVERSTRTIPFHDIDEKSIYRLALIGVIWDYTLNYVEQEYLVETSGITQEKVVEQVARYVGSYRSRFADEFRSKLREYMDDDHGKFLESVGGILIEFLYEHIEQARRTSLREMLYAADASQVGTNLQDRILDYFESSEFDPSLDEVVESNKGGLDKIQALVGEIESGEPAEFLRGAVTRYEVAHSDVPGLHLVRAFTEILSRDRNYDAASEMFDAAISFCDTLGIPETEVTPALKLIIDRASQIESGLGMEITKMVLTSPKITRPLVRDLVKQLEHGPALLAAEWLGHSLHNQVRSFLSNQEA